MPVNTLVPIFGGNRTNAHRPAEFLKGCSWIGVPFAGGMPEVCHFKARTILVSDANRFLINLAEVACHPTKGRELYKIVKDRCFHPDTLDWAQDECSQWERADFDMGDIELAADYFTVAWMQRSGIIGTDREFQGSLALRWDAGGGDSVVRFREACKMLGQFRRDNQRCQYTCMDWQEFMYGHVKDEDGIGVYEDPPWPDDGNRYKHKFTEGDQRKLAVVNNTFRKARIVIRYGDHPLVRELYPEERWEWYLYGGRTQANKEKQEVLLVNRRQGK